MGWRWKVLGAAAILAATWVVNAATLDYGFVYDDHAVIVEREPAWEQGWAEFLRTRHWGVGRHAVLASFDLDRREPLVARPFHVTNTILAGVAAVLVYGLALALGLGGFSALTAGLLFAVHPAHTDAVVSIVGRAELMAAIGVLGCLLLHIGGYRPRGFGLGLAGLLFVAALASKESAACLLLLLPAYDLLLGPGKSERFSIPVYLVYLLAMAVWLVIAWPLIGSIDPITYVDNPLAHVDAGKRVPVAAAILWRYAGLLVWPIHLVPDRSFAATDPAALAGLAGAMAVAGWLAIAATCWLARKRAPLVAFAMLWLPLAFAPTSNVLFPVGTIMAERLTYLPSVGPCLLAGVLVAALVRRGRFARVVARGGAMFVVLLFAFAYDARARVWTSSEHYHSVAAVESSRSAKAHYDLGLLRARAGDLSEAETSLRRALAIYPAFARAAYYLAEVLMEDGRPAEAAAVYESYLVAKPDDTAAMSQLLAIHLQRGRHRDALRIARRMVEAEPGNASYRATLSRLEASAR